MNQLEVGARENKVHTDELFPEVCGYDMEDAHEENGMKYDHTNETDASGCVDLPVSSVSPDFMLLNRRGRCSRGGSSGGRGRLLLFCQRFCHRVRYCVCFEDLLSC